MSATAKIGTMARKENTSGKSPFPQDPAESRKGSRCASPALWYRWWKTKSEIASQRRWTSAVLCLVSTIVIITVLVQIAYVCALQRGKDDVTSGSTGRLPLGTVPRRLASNSPARGDLPGRRGQSPLRRQSDRGSTTVLERVVSGTQGPVVAVDAVADGIQPPASESGESAGGSSQPLELEGPPPYSPRPDQDGRRWPAEGMDQRRQAEGRLSTPRPHHDGGSAPSNQSHDFPPHSEADIRLGPLQVGAVSQASRRTESTGRLPRPGGAESSARSTVDFVAISPPPYAEHPPAYTAIYSEGESLSGPYEAVLDIEEYNDEAENEDDGGDGDDDDNDDDYDDDDDVDDDDDDFSMEYESDGPPGRWQNQVESAYGELMANVRRALPRGIHTTARRRVTLFRTLFAFAFIVLLLLGVTLPILYGPHANSNGTNSTASGLNASSLVSTSPTVMTVSQLTPSPASETGSQAPLTPSQASSMASQPSVTPAPVSASPSSSGGTPAPYSQEPTTPSPQKEVTTPAPEES